VTPIVSSHGSRLSMQPIKYALCNPPSNNKTQRATMNNNNNNITDVVLSNDKMKLFPNVNPPCKYCQNVPCLLEDGLYELNVQYEEELRENDSTLTNKDIRFYLYRYVSRWIHGYLMMLL
jgi:hypothetical protein